MANDFEFEMIADMSTGKEVYNRWTSERSFRASVKNKYGQRSHVELFTDTFFHENTPNRVHKNRKALLKEFQLMEFDFEIVIVDSGGQWLIDWAYQKKDTPFIIYTVEDFYTLIEYSKIL